MFALEVEYLLGRVFAGSYENRSEPEWPPHPSRLYSALTASYFDGEGSDAERRALEWLERQDPPHIHAGQPGKPTKAMAYVPTNYPGDDVPVLRGKQPRFFPAQAPSSSLVYFIWPEADPGDHRVALERLASRTAYLGKSSSLVRMLVTETAPPPNWVPDRAGHHTVRVARPGRLRELEWLFAADRRPTTGALQAYRYESGTPVEQTVEGEFGELVVFRLREGPGLPIEATLTLTEVVRRALIRCAEETGAVPVLLHGRGSERHCAFGALPFVDAPHADGHLMGFAVVLPRAADTGERRRVLGACGRLKTLNLKPLGLWSVELQEATPLQTMLQPRTWTRSARVWGTVTPILLDRFPKKKGPTVPDILAEACAHVGLPAPARMEHGPYSAIAGVPPVPSFRLQREKDGRPRWGVHARIEFPVPVGGPVLLGAGRFFGLGLLKPLQEEA